MKTYETPEYAIESAYNNGYKKGYEDGKKDAVKPRGCPYCDDGRSFIGAVLILGNDGKWHEINHCPNCGADLGGAEDG